VNLPITDRINAERLALLGWSRAILLQVAHPLVAAGVAEHSSFRAGPLAAVGRLRSTVRAMRAIAFGDASDRNRALQGIRSIHDRVHGRLSTAVGSFPTGTSYSAHNPALLLWVHATLIESVVMVHDQLISPLGTEERDAYCQDAASVAIDLGAVEADVPRSWSDLAGYLDRELRSGRISVGDDARRIAKALLSPSVLSTLAGPVAWTNRVVTIGLLPDGVRAQYGYPWTSAEASRFARVMRGLRRARAMMPARVAMWPEGRARVMGKAVSGRI
jgi:uncharacterized protein (DUF2236 family)